MGVSPRNPSQTSRRQAVTIPRTPMTFRLPGEFGYWQHGRRQSSRAWWDRRFCSLPPRRDYVSLLRHLDHRRYHVRVTSAANLSKNFLASKSLFMLLPSA